MKTYFKIIAIVVSDPETVLREATTLGYPQL